MKEEGVTEGGWRCGSLDNGGQSPFARFFQEQSEVTAPRRPVLLFSAHREETVLRWTVAKLNLGWGVLSHDTQPAKHFYFAARKGNENVPRTDLQLQSKNLVFFKTD